MALKPLLARLKKGDAKAEKALFLATTKLLMSVALRYVVDESAARDVLQESYIRIFQKLPQFQYSSEAQTYAWMRQITAREAIRWLKKQKRWQLTDVQLHRESITESHPMFQDDLYRNLLRLSIDQRLVFNLKIIEGYSHKEIGEKLQIAESSSRSLLTRARQNLVQLIEKQAI